MAPDVTADSSVTTLGAPGARRAISADLHPIA
jgi:hypothetical protein